ncbi:MAG TPA: RNA polymerase sigma factor [bacterium]|nr:RNA polymerase sigma factor [bacterium]HOL65949.1 RNA polymerase sigma factor [bacterium]HPP11198.1 RNA polymerase sigma factor [bacterium]
MEKEQKSFLEEKTLIERAQQGDSQAFETLVRLYMRWAYQFAFQFSQQHALADEISQEAFVILYQNLRRFRGQASLKTYLGRIIINLWHRFLRQKTQQQKLLTMVEKTSQTTLENPEMALQKLNRKEQLWQAVEKLPAGQKQVIVLRYFQEKKVKEVAEILGCREGTVKAQIFTAVARLKRYLRP